HHPLVDGVVEARATDHVLERDGRQDEGHQDTQDGERVRGTAADHVATEGRAQDAGERRSHQGCQRNGQERTCGEGCAHLCSCLFCRASTLERVEFLGADRAAVAEQQHEDGQADGGFGRGHGQDEEHEHLAMHVAQVVREGYEVHVDGQQHQLDGHEQHDQVLAVEEDPDHRQREQDRADREKVSECQSHDALPSSWAAGAGSAGRVVAAMGTTTRRSAARTRTWSPGLMALLSLRWGSVRASAVSLAASRMTAATWMGYRYSVYSRMPSALVLDAPSAAPATSPPAIVGKPTQVTAAISAATSAPITSASGKFCQKLQRSPSKRMSSIITTNRNSTITAPRYTSTRVMPRNSALRMSHSAAACVNDSMR